MIIRHLGIRAAILCAALGILASCDTAEERAEKHLQNATEYLQSGDTDRAIVEFRNVFALDPNNLDARMLYAKTVRATGNLPESFANFLKVAEAEPDNAEARLALAELAIEAQDWDEAARHGTALIDSGAPIDGARTIDLALKFREAVVANRAPRINELTNAAILLAIERPNDVILQRLLIEGLARQGDIAGALEVMERALDLRPNDQSLYRVRANLLTQSGDASAIEQHLRESFERFPEDRDNLRQLVSFLIAQNRIGEAEQLLRDDIAAAEDKETAHITLINFLRQAVGNKQALEELDVAVETYEDDNIFKALRAGITFDQGDRSDAIEMMQDILSSSDPDSQTNRFKVALAKMLIATDQRSSAEQIIDAVLLDDPVQVDALKVRARWQIDADNPSDALKSVRAALDRQPDDVEALMLMSEAHQRNGDAPLSLDILSLAVEKSGNAPRESLLFATRLFEEGRYRPAEDVLVSALRRAPNNVELLVLLGQVHVASQNWPRALQVESTLRNLNLEQADDRAEELQFQIYGRREGRDKAIAFLEELVSTDRGNARAATRLIREKLVDGRADEAVEIAENLVSDRQQDPRAKLILGQTLVALQRYEDAEDVMRDVYESTGSAIAALQLINVVGAQARPDEAQNILEDALQQSPQDPNLLWAKASILERANDIEGAIAIYEELYARDTGSIVVANNLASLLVTYREDDASLARATAVGARLRGTDNPAFQDTYGWILYRNGTFDEAVQYLEPAAKALNQDPIVQFHLAKVYDALGRSEDARSYFQRTLELSAPNDTRPQILETKDILSRDNN